MEILYYVRRTEVGVQLMPASGSKFNKEERDFIQSALISPQIYVERNGLGFRVSSEKSSMRLAEICQIIEDKIPKLFPLSQHASSHRFNLRCKQLDNSTGSSFTSKWIDSFFGFKLNSFNKKAMESFLDGNSKSFFGLLDRRGVEVMKKNGFTTEHTSMDGNPIDMLDLDALRSHFSELVH
jgi:hypothetical protein